MRLDVVFTLKRFAAQITLEGLSTAVRSNVLCEILHFVKLSAAEVAAVALEQLLVVLLVELEVELALVHLPAHSARMILGALHTELFI